VSSFRQCLALALALGALAACDRDPAGDEPAPSAGATGTARAARPSLPIEPPPRLLHLPDGGDIAPPPGAAPGRDLLPGPWGIRGGRCSAEMVDVGGRFCIDRWEASLLDAAGGRRISPHYHPTRRATAAAYGRWQKARLEAATAEGRSMPVPAPPDWQLREQFEPRAEARAGTLPNGYLDAEIAERACRNAGKRLCTPDEWVLACRGQKNRKFPYGDRYQAGVCNVFRESHPAALLHGNASINHSDPRLTLVQFRGRPLLRPTGTTDECKSEWGADAIFDMVGNLDEWVDDPGGMFLGGFFSRGTREGCDSKITSHPRNYWDYSLGVRCCK
jgi:formylglycine-generating enzyme